MSATDPFWNLQITDPELHSLTELVYHGFKYPDDPRRDPQYRLAALLPAMTYARIPTAEVAWIDGGWKIGTFPQDQARRDRFLAELSAIKVGAEKDSETVKGEIASLLLRFHTVHPSFVQKLLH